MARSYINREFIAKLVACLFIFQACNPDSGLPSFNLENVDGMIPLYNEDISIELKDPQSIQNPGKILSIGSILLINERGKGIHVIDNNDLENPIPLYFVKIPYNNDLAVQGDLLYADNGPDLVTLKMSSSGFEEIARTKNVFFDAASFSNFPPQSNVYFECPDTNKGEIIGWLKGRIAKPDCYKN